MNTNFRLKAEATGKRATIVVTMTTNFRLKAEATGKRATIVASGFSRKINGVSS